MFTTSCFIRKCTPELKSKLEDIGYHRRPIKEKYDKHKFLLVYRDGCYNSSTGNETGIENYIDCGYNEEMFLAIAALRDDTDKGQLIRCAEIHDGFIICTKDSIDEFLNYEFPNELYRKATVEELIEHFKNI